MNTKTKKIIMNAILLALLIISAKIAIPITTISFTLQVLVVLIIALICDIKDSLLIMIVYFIMGLGLQLPVFSTGGGYSYVLMPSFGFILGFLGCIAPVYYTKKALDKIIKIEILNYIIASFIGLIVIYLIGLGYGALIFNCYRGSNKTFMELVKIFIVPFVVIDISKVCIASIIAYRLNIIIRTKMIKG